MKPNQTKYLLGIALIAIWGLLGFRIYQKYAPSTAAIQWASATTPTDIVVVEAQPFHLSNAAYRDPFLDNTLKKERSTTAPRTRTIATTVRRRAPQRAKPVKFPAIAYKGHIVLKDGGVAAVLKVEKELVNLSVGDTFAEVELLEMAVDSIRIVYQGNAKTVLKVR